MRTAARFYLNLIRLTVPLLFASQAVFAEISTAADFLNNLEDLQNPQFITTPNDDHDALLQAFNNANESIKVGIFGISGKHIADGLEAAQKRGVSVTVICDKYCISGEKRLAIINQLKAGGVTVHMATTGFSISHWKMFVIDDKKVFISTMNFISRANQMRDLGIFVTNPKIIKEVLAVFDADIKNSKDNTAITPTLTHPNLLWSPVNAENKLVHLIDSASDTIEIWIENMGNPAVHAALKAAVQRKVKVRVLTSLCGLGMEPKYAFSMLHKLDADGITVKMMPFPATEHEPYVHAKVIIADRQEIFLGSENFSYNSLQKARELGIIFRNEALQAKISGLFESDWRQTVPLPAVPPEKCEPLRP